MLQTIKRISTQRFGQIVSSLRLQVKGMWNLELGPGGGPPDKALAHPRYPKFLFAYSATLVTSIPSAGLPSLTIYRMTKMFYDLE